MMSAHESFEQLCALAITGDLDPEEFRRLGEHLYECVSCRASYRDFHAIVERGFPAAGPERATRWSLSRWGIKKRFVERALRQGIRIQESRREWTRVWRILAPASAVVLLIGLAGYGAVVYRTFRNGQRDAAREIALLSSKVGELERRLADYPSAA